ncbi:glycosyltransferase family 4 protein [Roseovarius sp. 2305UL8-3]|uniref:glycosyltransferase family 4 protein n=1 Tax=Roseovarius conchicola TaxID=3121636 RepID=UPI003528DA5F
MSEPHIVLLGGDGHASGVPRHITDLVGALQGHARLTVISEPDQGGYANISALGAKHVALPGLASRLDPRHWRAARGALAACLTDHPADLVWAHARMPVLALRQLMVSGQWQPDHHGPSGTRVALTYHGLPFGRGHRPGTSTPARRIERRLLTACPPLDLVFLTPAQRDRMQAEMGEAMTGHVSHVLGNASHLGSVSGRVPDQVSGLSRPPGRHIVMTGRVGWQKNYAAALRLMRHLPGDVTLSLCGAGTNHPRFAQQVQRLAGAAAGRVRLLGPLPDVRPLLAQADGYMLSSRYEGQPIGALEACEYGLPLILGAFDGATALAEGHPLALCLQGNRAAQVTAIDDMLTRYLADRKAYEAAIRSFWASRYAPERFATEARALAATLLTGRITPD